MHHLLVYADANLLEHSNVLEAVNDVDLQINAKKYMFMFAH
jgi:hypothetical protein